MGTVAVDDFDIGTQAAVAGGTTFISMLLKEDERREGENGK
jgi:hypothetical protein